jgi:phospholipid/cholesterol/gamma-HCH transport system ATP-binding protein
LIEIVDLKKNFGSKEVLRGVNLKIKNGEVMVIIGGSGAGKTILLRHIIGLMKPDKGDVLIDGVSVPKSSTAELEKLRKRFGMVFQSGALLNSLTAGENVALPLVEHTTMSKAQIMGTVTEKLNLVHLRGIEKEKIANLSGGMKKRVAVARAIVRDPEIILYDEPTSELDPIMAHSIVNLIVHLKKHLGFISIVVTHDIEAAYKVGNRIAMLHEGRIVETGSPNEIAGSSNPIIKRFIHGEISD